MKSITHALKSAATRLGISPEEYMTRLDAGEKWCYKCRQWKMRAFFGQDKSRSDGCKAVCTICTSQRKRSSPGKQERDRMRIAGFAYCRRCQDWLPLREVHGGLCRTHINQESRQRYATDPRYRQERRQHSHARQHGVDPIPVIGQECLLDRFCGQCAYCGAPATSWDHIIPISKHGKTIPGNIVPACRSCNSSKGNRDVFLWVKAKGKMPHPEWAETLILAECSLIGE